MVKKLGIALLIALVATMLFSGAVLADDPDEVKVNWDGAGYVGGSVNTGDASATFQSASTGSNIGAFSATDQNNNPYSYGVDSCNFSLDTNIAGMGEAFLNVDRLTSKESMYGVAGQLSRTYVWIDDGAATLQNRSSTNFASMKDCNYGWEANDHLTVTGSSFYVINRWMDSGTGNFAGIQATGGGDADFDCMSSEASANQVRLGWGCGCYTNADFTASGVGTMKLSAVGNNSVDTAAISGMSGATSFDLIASWVSGFSLADYSTTAQ